MGYQANQNRENTILPQLSFFNLRQNISCEGMYYVLRDASLDWPVYYQRIYLGSAD